MNETRKKIHPATEAALWTVSNGRCYAPGCPFPVVFEVRPGVYRKNAQVAHIYGVRGARRNKEMPTPERDSFEHLILLCMPHHAEVDDAKTGEINYPSELLKEWKVKHEGSNGPALALLGIIDEDRLSELLVDVFSPPIKRLQAIADQLEQTGELNANSVNDLRQIVDVLASTPAGPDEHTASSLVWAADVFSGLDLKGTADSLNVAADVLNISDLTSAAETLRNATDALDINGLSQAADSLRNAADHLDVGGLNSAAEAIRNAADMAINSADHFRR